MDEKQRAQLQAWAEKPHQRNCRCWFCGPNAPPTEPERVLCEVLLAEFPHVIPQRRFGRYRVDAYLPFPYHLAFEADGEYWHARVEKARPDYYKNRDAYLLVRFGLPVVRIGEAELRALSQEKNNG